jgi:hypothetical protein
MHPEARCGPAALAAGNLCSPRGGCHRRKVVTSRTFTQIADCVRDAAVGSEPGLDCCRIALRTLQCLEPAQRCLVDRQRLLDVLHDRGIRPGSQRGLRLRRVGRAHGIGALDEVGVRHTAAARECDQRACNDASTSPGSGKRSTSCLEKTSSPSRTTSNCPETPGAIVASNPCSFSSAARLAARRSYPLQTGQ